MRLIMRRIYVMAAASLLLLLGVGLIGKGTLLAEGAWGVVPQVQESLVILMGPNEDGSHWTCAAFSIHRQQGLFLTAAHCVDEGRPLSLRTLFAPIDIAAPAHVLWQDVGLDLAVLEANIHRPALRPRAKEFARGLEVGALGFAWGQGLYFAAGVVANVHVYTEWNENGGRWEGAFLTVDGPVNGGMSGGPWFDRHGRVVGIVQRGTNITSFGRPINLVFSATQAYWQYKR